MKRVFLVAVLLGAAVILGNQGRESRAAAQGRQAEAVRKLLVERLQTLRSIEEIFKQRHRVGNVGADEVHGAVMARLASELDLAESRQARIAILETRVEKVKELEGAVSARQKAGTATELEVLGARARRLEAEIALERERSSTP